MSYRIKFGWQPSKTLTYGAYNAAGSSVVVAAGTSLPQGASSPGYYTVVDAVVTPDDFVVVKEGTVVVGSGEIVPVVEIGGVVSAAGYVGDYKIGETLFFTFKTNGTIGSEGDGLRVYRSDDTTPVTPSLATLDDDFSSETNVHQVAITLLVSSYIVGNDYSVVLSGATIGDEVVTTIVGSFSIENRYQRPVSRYNFP